MSTTCCLLLFVLADASDARQACRIKAEVVGVSPGWSCPSRDAELRAFEDRICIALLRQQRPHTAYRTPPGGRLDEARPVPPEQAAAAWKQWSRPVVVGTSIRPKELSPPETTESGLRPGDHGIDTSSGDEEVDMGALMAVATSGRRGVFEDCRRNYWSLKITFTPPAIPLERQPAVLRGFLNGSDPWTRLMAAAALLGLGKHEQVATVVLQGFVESGDTRLREAAASALREPELYK